MKARYLIDKSALARMPLAAVRDRLAPIIEAGEAETCAVIDLDKVCTVRVEMQAGHHYQKVAIRFVDGREDDDVVPEQYAHHLLDAYRAYLGGAAK